MSTSYASRLRFIPLILWLILIFIVSHQPSASIPEYGSWDILVKKGGHLAAYAVLAILARWAGLSVKHTIFLALIYAVSDEYHQTFVAGRSGNVTDVVIDLLGAGLGLLLYRLLGVWLPGFESAQKAEADEPSPRDA